MKKKKKPNPYIPTFCKEFLRKPNKLSDIVGLGFKLHYKAVVINIVWHASKSGDTAQQNDVGELSNGQTV